MSFNAGRVSRVQKHLILQAKSAVEGRNEKEPGKEVTLVDELASLVVAEIELS